MLYLLLHASYCHKSIRACKPTDSTSRCVSWLPVFRPSNDSRSECLCVVWLRSVPCNSDQWVCVGGWGGGEHKGSVVVVLGGQLRSGSHVNEILDLRQGQQQRFSLFFSHCLLFQHPPPPPPSFLLSSFPPLCSPSCLPPLSSVFERAVHMEGKPGHHHFFKNVFLLITYYPSEHGIHVNTQEESWLFCG